MNTPLLASICLPADLERPWHPEKCAGGANRASAADVRNQNAQVDGREKTAWNQGEMERPGRDGVVDRSTYGAA